MASHVTQSKSRSLHNGLKDLPISVPYLISYHLISDLITYLFPPCSLCSRHIGLLAGPQPPTILPPQDICLCCSFCGECSSPRCLCLVCPLNNFSSFSGVTIQGCLSNHSTEHCDSRTSHSLCLTALTILLILLYIFMQQLLLPGLLYTCLFIYFLYFPTRE